MQIVAVGTDDAALIAQMARLLMLGFRATSPDDWTTLEEALRTVNWGLSEGFCRAALDDSGAVVGWIGGLPQYDGHVYELHPLVVDPGHQGQGIGRALVLDLEDQVRVRGGLTVLLGTDDQIGGTTLGGVDLYDDLPGKLAGATGSPPHALEFYRRLGYTLVGVVPDANGRGKPDILMAKRV